MADDKTTNDPPLIERWLAEQQQWQRTLLTYMDSMVKNEDFLVHLGNAMRGSLLAGKAYPTSPAPGAAEPETPADDKLDQILFALRQLEGQVQDLRLTLDELRAEKELRKKALPGKPKEPTVNEAEPEPERDQERELEALLELSRRGRSKLERLHEILTTPGHYGTGATPATVVYRENKLRLLRLLDESGQPRSGPPVLFIPAPVSRYFILDLLPGRSFAGHVAAAGFDVYIADFGTPSREDRFADLTYYVEGLVRRSVRTVAAMTGEDSINVVGYCLGGTLSLLYAALHPETVRRLVLLTTTVDGDVEGGIPWVAHQMGLAGESYDNPRLVPAAEVKSWFEMLAPGSNSVIGRVSDLWDRLDDAPERLREVRTMASWVDDVVPAPGRLLAELYSKLGPGTNGLMKGTATVADRLVDCASVAMPVLSVSAEKDTIAPPAGVDAIRSLVPHAEVLRLPGGHVGIVAGRAAAKLWQRTVEFLGPGEHRREA